MSSQAKSAYATILKSNGTEIAELTSISGPSQKAKSIDVSNMDSPSGYSEYIPGMLDAGQISIEGNFTGVASQTQAFTDFANRAVNTFVITIPTATSHTFTCTGSWIDIAPDAKVAGALTFKASIQVSGVCTFV